MLVICSSISDWRQFCFYVLAFVPLLQIYKYIYYIWSVIYILSTCHVAQEVITGELNAVRTGQLLYKFMDDSCNSLGVAQDLVCFFCSFPLANPAPITLSVTEGTHSRTHIKTAFTTCTCAGVCRKSDHVLSLLQCTLARTGRTFQENNLLI